MTSIDPNYKKSVQFFINAQEASPGPPVGTVLGNTGINTAKFADAFNTYTSGLPTYFALKVTVYIYENASFAFEVNSPSTGS
jgi:large subunit ribosomal protein L11